MKLIDLHCDTASKMIMDKDNTRLLSNELSVDINKLKKGDSLAQVFALYLDLKFENPYEYCVSMAENLINEIEKNKDSIAIALNHDEIIKNHNEGKISAILSIEEGGALEGKIENLKKFYDIGIRMMTLTWNYENEIGYPNCNKETMNNGLKKFGYEVVECMNDLGIIVDVSHLSDGGFYDVSRIIKGPFVASHSNARSLTSHPRNLTDDMIKILAEHGGVTGINFCSSFIGDRGNDTYIEDIIRHIKYIRNLGGIDVLAIGSDFDGITSKVEICDISEMGKLAKALESNGFSCDEIEKIFYKNAMRIIKDVLR